MPGLDVEQEVTSVQALTPLILRALEQRSKLLENKSIMTL
jgi:hypothetical protein